MQRIEARGGPSALGHALCLPAIAVGVGIEEQPAFVEANGCDSGRDCLFSPLLPPTSFVRLLTG